MRDSAATEIKIKTSRIEKLNCKYHDLILILLPEICNGHIKQVNFGIISYLGKVGKMLDKRF